MERRRTVDDVATRWGSAVDSAVIVACLAAGQPLGLLVFAAVLATTAFGGASLHPGVRAYVLARRVLGRRRSTRVPEVGFRCGAAIEAGLLTGASGAWVAGSPRVGMAVAVLALLRAAVQAGTGRSAASILMQAGSRRGSGTGHEDPPGGRD